MAAGYAFVTGRGQGVLVHVDVGTANTANAMHNLFRSRLPVLLMAGKAPYTVNDELVGSRDTYVHFVQEPFDQASLVRPYLKWEWTLPSGVVVKEALRRAHSIMQSEPRGPVYLMMQRETLTQHWGDRRNAPLFRRSVRRHRRRRRRSEARRRARRPAADGGKSDPDHRLCRAPRACLQGDRRAGAVRRHRGVRIQHDQQHLARQPVLRRLFARQGGCRMPMSASWSMSTCRGSRATCRRNEKSFWAHIDIDMLKPGSPMWTFPGNLRMQGDQRPHPRAGARRPEGEGDAALQGRRRGAPRRASRLYATSALRAPQSSRPTRASRARSIRII